MSEILDSEYLLDVKGLTTYFDITEALSPGRLPGFTRSRALPLGPSG